MEETGGAPGLIRRLKVNASPSPDSLLWRTTGFVWEGFAFEPAGEWSPAIVTVDNAIRKTETFTNAQATVDFTFYSGEPRVNYAYRLAPGLKTAGIGVSWAPGGGIGHGDFYYPGSSGKTLTCRAARDWISDSEKSPLKHYGFPWFDKGWYAFCDRKTHDAVGMVFDREAFDGVSYLAGANHAGEVARLRFRHRPQAGECACGSGALVATVGGYRDVENVYELLRNPSRVFVAHVQPYLEFVARPRDFVHDWCVNTTASAPTWRRWSRRGRTPRGTA